MRAPADFQQEGRDGGTVRFTGNLSLSSMGTMPQRLDALQHAVRHRRQPERRMHGAGHFGQVVGIRGGTGHVQMRRLVCAADTHLGEGRGQCKLGRLVHASAPRANTLTCASLKGASVRVSSQKRRSRFCATCSR